MHISCRALVGIPTYSGRNKPNSATNIWSRGLRIKLRTFQVDNLENLTNWFQKYSLIAARRGPKTKLNKCSDQMLLPVLLFGSVSVIPLTCLCA